MYSAAYYIEKLGLRPHPEGGFYTETYRSDERIEGLALPGRYGGARCFSTSIYFLLRAGEISEFHKVASDELWFYHTGSPIELYFLTDAQAYTRVVGPDLEQGQSLQLVVPTDTWFGAKVVGPENFSLVSCTVAPGFEFADFVLGNRAELANAFPQHASFIDRLA